MKSALLGHPITVFGDGKQSRCFTDVDDVTHAMVKLMETEKAMYVISNLKGQCSLPIYG